MFVLLTTYKSAIYTLIFLYIISLQNSYLFTFLYLSLLYLFILNPNKK